MKIGFFVLDMYFSYKYFPRLDSLNFIFERQKK